MHRDLQSAGVVGAGAGAARTSVLRDMLLTLVVLIAGTFATATLADTRVALVIANGDYTSAPLANPETDANMVAPKLREMGFDVTLVLNADLATFDSAINDFSAKAKGADLALFYFAGHGFALNNGIQVQSYLMSTSADVTSSSDRVIISGGIPLDVIASQLTAAAKTTLIFVDACRNDPRVRAIGNSGRGLAPVGDYVSGDVFIGLSTRIGDTADDGKPGEGSPFARAFVTHMGEPGTSVDRAFNKVRIAVQNETGSQRPEAERADLTDPDSVILMASLGEGDRGLDVRPIEQTGGDTPDDLAARNEEAARLTWESVADSTSIAILRRFAESYEGTVYASFALARADELAGTSPELPRNNVVEEDKPSDPSGSKSKTQIANLPQTTDDDLPGQTNSAGSELCGKEAVAPGFLSPGVIDPTYIDATEAIAACMLAVTVNPGDHRLEYLLGRAFDVAADPASARQWYEKAAVGGIVEAMSPVGHIYERGEVVAQDLDRARYWYDQAAKHNDIYALRSLGFMYEYGTGVPIDRERARAYFAPAADQGDVDAILMMAHYTFNGVGGPVNYEEAFAWYSLAAAQNARDGLYMLGYMSRDGLGVPQDNVSAREWFRLASEQNSALAMHSLALLLDSGTGGPRDPVEAARLVTRALELGEQFTYDQLATNSTGFSPDMRTEIQRVLQQKGFYTGSLDGEFGRGTIAAIDALRSQTASN